MSELFHIELKLLKIGNKKDSINVVYTKFKITVISFVKTFFVVVCEFHCTTLYKHSSYMVQKYR